MSFFSSFAKGAKSLGSALKSGIGKIGSFAKQGLGKIGGVQGIIKGVGRAAEIGSGLTQAFAPLLTPEQQQAAQTGFALTGEGANIAQDVYDTSREVKQDVTKGGISALPEAARKAIERFQQVDAFAKKVAKAKHDAKKKK